MRMMMKVTLPVEASNKAIKDGSLPKTIQSAMDELHPEAAYFFTENGKRTCMMVFEMKDPAQIPVIAEPLFMNLNAEVQMCPVMNAEDLKTGLEKVMKNAGRVPAHA